MNIDFTVAIPTYNGAKRLPELLERLRNQVNAENLNWEIIIVDNNSTDNTAEVVKSYQESWQISCSLRYFLETKQGSAHARKLAVAQANGKFIGFLDDDNYPELNWVANAYSFGEKYPQAGAFASQIHPNWEVSPPENFQRIAPFLAITERGNLPLLYNPNANLLPPSAGLVIRHQAWLDAVPETQILIGRVGGNLLAGEDLEMIAHIQKAGWEIWYNPEMEVYHQIPQWRLQRDYLIPFFRGIGLSRYVTRMGKIKPFIRPFAYVAYIVNDLRKLILHVIKYRWQVRSELVAACEMELFISSLISPFYLWKNGYLK
jgi:glycosyltransferase involved in cell wall biosynthesis